MGAELTGTVRIYASQLIAITLMPALLATLLREQPGLQLELVATDELPDLLSRDADIGFWLVEPTQPDTVCRKLGTVRIQAMASRSYLDHFAAIGGLIVGGVLAAPLAGLLVKRIPTKALTIAVGVLITALAGYQTWQLLA